MIKRSLFLTPVLAIAAFHAAAQNTAAPAPPPSWASNPEYQKQITEAKTLETQHRYAFARDAYNKADQAAQGQCAACVVHEYKLDMMMHEWKKAIEDTDELQRLSTSDSQRSSAYTRRGQTLMSMAGEHPKPEKLRPAHEAFSQALVLSPDNVNALFDDGGVLAKMGNFSEAGDRFKKCAALISAKDPARIRAQHFAENPELATHPSAPSFEITALDGSRFNLDSMTGRVVLIDFWATWCGPCNESLPELKKIAEKFKNEPLTIISISWDSDEEKWKHFIQQHEMSWTQYRDADHSLTNRFGINSIPHYFTIDSDGVLTAEMIGSNSNVEGKLKKLLAKATESAAATQHTDSQSSTDH
ncbi:MAG: redoxin family protein [Acidobacteriaceae bacterium]|nr:redoxin family protein [Acidobacteriaceae bacterium]